MKILTSLIAGGMAVSSLSAQIPPFLANSIDGVTYASGIDQGETAIASASDFAVASMLAGPGFHGGYAYNTFDSDAVGNTRPFETEITQHSGQVAYVHDFDALLAGIALSYLDSDSESDYSNAGNTGQVDLEGDGWIVALSTARSWGQLTASLSAGMGQLSIDSTRNGLVGGTATPKTASFDTDLVFVNLYVDYGFEISETINLSPFAQLNYQDVSMDGFVEQGTPDAGSVNSTDRDWVTGELGVRSDVEFSDTLAGFFSVSLQHEFNDDDTTLSGFDGVPTFGSSDVDNVGQTRIKAALGVDYSINEEWSLAAGIQGSSGDDVQTMGGSLLLSRKF